MPRSRRPPEHKANPPRRCSRPIPARQIWSPSGTTKAKPAEVDAITLASLFAPSPRIADTTTTHNQMLFWVDLFARMHRPSPGFVPYEIKTIDCPVAHRDGTPCLRSDGQPEMMRCIREVARHAVGDRVEWVVFSWNIGQVGIEMPSFPTLSEAMVSYNAPPSLVLLP